jgi:hypothetical protein
MQVSPRRGSLGMDAHAKPSHAVHTRAAHVTHQVTLFAQNCDETILELKNLRLSPPLPPFPVAEPYFWSLTRLALALQGNLQQYGHR